jgi:hypothetical protein
MAATDYKRLYYKTSDIISRFKPSLSSYFDVFINASFGEDELINNSDINFLAYEAVLPGTSYQTTEVFGDRQGITETFANKRVYPPVDVSFYIDYEYDVLRYFESWMKNISPNLGTTYSSYQKFQYPKNNGKDGYKKEVIITKFERDFRRPDQRLEKNGIYGIPDNYCTYTLRNAYPVNLISVPVSYDQSNLLRTTVTFNYDVYAFEQKNGNEINKPLGDNSSTSGPGGDSALGSLTGSDLDRAIRAALGE